MSGDPHPPNRLHLDMYAAEAAGTLLLVAVGLSIVIALWGKGAPLAWLPISSADRRLLNGFLVGGIGAAIAYSPIGRISGAHINPAMTLAFWLEGMLRWQDAGCYLAAPWGQLCSRCSGGRHRRERSLGGDHTGGHGSHRLRCRRSRSCATAR